MSTRPLNSVLAVLLIFAFIVSPMLVMLPKTVYAQAPVAEAVVNPVAGGATLMPAAVPIASVGPKDIIQTIMQTLSEASNFTNMLANTAQTFNMQVLQPLAFVLSGNLMKMLTVGVIAFVTGKANGTGIPQFVTDVQKSFQTVADSQALAYLNQMQRNSNSPFKSSIAFSLRKEYLNKTSLAGVWAANMNTLSRNSPNVNAYLAGNWSQGGVAAWFALTTQTQNNPYTAYQSAQSQMSSLIGAGAGGATGARQSELSWGQGFTSWCGAFENDTVADQEDRDAVAQPTSSTGVNPGDPCVKDGVPGTIKTPGSVIVATLNKVLGGQQDQITRMGNVGPEITNILGNIATVMKTVNFAVDILGNASLSTATGGLLGADEPSSSGSASRLLQYQNVPGNLGVTNTTIYNNNTNVQTSGPDMLNRATQYDAAWATIVTAANSASTTLNSLANYCIAEQAVAPSILNNGYGQSVDSFIVASNAQATAARTAITTQIAPILAQATNAATTTAVARAFVQKINLEKQSTSDATASAYTADIQTLQTMTPTYRDLVNLQQETQTTGAVTATPAGSLVVSGGTMMDRLTLLSNNAVALQTSVCTPIHVDPPQSFE